MVLNLSHDRSRAFHPQYFDRRAPFFRSVSPCELLICCGEFIGCKMTRTETPAPWMVSAAVLLPLALVANILLFCFDPSSHGFYPTCLFHQTTGLLCPGCGSLRALHQLLHGHIEAAFHFNPLLVLSLPLFVWFAGLYCVRMFRNQSFRFRVSPRWVWIGIVIIFAFSVWRNLPGSPFALLDP